MFHSPPGGTEHALKYLPVAGRKVDSENAPIFPKWRLMFNKIAYTQGGGHINIYKRGSIREHPDMNNSATVPQCLSASVPQKSAFCRSMLIRPPQLI
jgi:hypothetical protein